MNPETILKRIEAEEICFVDLRFTDTKGKEQHVTVPAATVDEEFFEEGKMFDGSSIAGWKGINESDMILMPDAQTPFIDPFAEQKTLAITCDIIEPDTLRGYVRDPRSLAKRAEAYLQSAGIADTALFGPENEFFIFDGIKYKTAINKTWVEILCEEGCWNSDADFEGLNKGHRPGLKGGYFPVSPVDSLSDIRSEICAVLEQVGLHVEVHHHEVATAGQCEIGVRFNTLTRKADEVQKLKYVVLNVADSYAKTATFMPKPLVGDNGNGMHVHMSLGKDGRNLFTGDLYGGLSQTALHYIGGIIKHAKALNAFTNAAVNSYKRLVPGFEAPVMLAYSARNRSAAIRVPYIFNPKARRIEVRFPDSTANPYLAFAAILMAGIDGIRNKIDPGEAMDKDLYDLPPEEADNIAQVAFSLEEALNALEADSDFLKEGEVFNDELLEGYIALKREEVEKMRLQVHPLEYELYYSC